jgi:hypothetical protein
MKYFLLCFEVICKGCDENEAVVYCVQCDKDFCEACSNSVHIPKKFSSHTRTSQKEKPLPPVVCEEHVDTQVTFFCTNCSIAVCVYCVNPINGKHKPENNNHKCLALAEASIPPIKTALEQKLTEFEPKIDKFRELRKSALADQQGCLNSVKNVFAEVRSILAAKESEMVAKINSFFSISASSPEETLATCDQQLALSKAALAHASTADQSAPNKLIQV